MDISELAVALLNDFTVEERSIPDHADFPGRNAAVLNAINSGLQEMFGEGSPFIRYAEQGDLLYAPTTVTISVTNGARGSTITSGYAAWMDGCSIVIEGSDVTNKLTATSSPNLKFPYNGTTGSKSAVVYCDCISVPASVMEVCDPVKSNNRVLAAVVSSGMSLNRDANNDYGFTGLYRQQPEPQPIGTTAGQPIAYAVEHYNDDDIEAPVIRLKIIPAPSEAGTIEFRAKLAPPVVPDLTTTEALPIPLHFMESLVYPMARKHLSGCPFFVHSSAAGEIERAYREALRLLERLKPGKNSGRQNRSLY